MQNTPRSKKFGEEPTADADKEKYGGGAPVTLDMMSGLTLNGLSYMMASDQQEGWEDKLVEPGFIPGPPLTYVYTAMYLAPVTVSACSTKSQGRQKMRAMKVCLSRLRDTLI